MIGGKYEMALAKDERALPKYERASAKDEMAPAKDTNKYEMALENDGLCYSTRWLLPRTRWL